MGAVVWSKPPQERRDTSCERITHLVVSDDAKPAEGRGLWSDLMNSETKIVTQAWQAAAINDRERPDDSFFMLEKEPPTTSMVLPKPTIPPVHHSGPFNYLSLLKSPPLVASLDSDKWHLLHNGALGMYTQGGCKPSKKVAAFDVDSTLVQTKSGKSFPEDATDWTWLYKDGSIERTLKQLAREGYKIVLISNQKGVTASKNSSHGMVQEKFNLIMNDIKSWGVYVQAFYATEDDIFRKPRLGMWQYASQVGSP